MDLISAIHDVCDPQRKGGQHGDRQCPLCAKNETCAFDDEEIPVPCDFFVAGEPYLNASEKIDILLRALRGFIDSESDADVMCDCSNCRQGRAAIAKAEGKQS